MCLPAWSTRRSVSNPSGPGTAPTTRSAFASKGSSAPGAVTLALAVRTPGTPSSRASAAGELSATVTSNSPARSRAMAAPTRPAPSSNTRFSAEVIIVPLPWRSSCPGQLT